MLFEDLTHAVARWIRVEREIRRLRWLDDRLLGDMGIERDRISSLVRRPKS